MNEIEEDGREAKLIDDYRGYMYVRLIKNYGDRWLVRVEGSGKEMEVYEGDLIIED